VAPDHLTALAVAGSLVAGLALVACRLSPWFLLPFYLGLLVNWFGDSFDGAIARYRRCERHRIGFLIDRCSDVLSFCIIILALGLSPYLSLNVALMLLVAYLIHAIYGLMRMVVDGAQIVGLGGIGATEGRLIIGLWAGLIQIAPFRLGSLQVAKVDVFDAVCGALLVGHLVIFVWRVAFDVRRISVLEEPAVSLDRAKYSGDKFFVVYDGAKSRSQTKRDVSLDSA
jgi:phosphatidylglycerophosphate synthase